MFGMEIGGGRSFLSKCPDEGTPGNSDCSEPAYGNFWLVFMLDEIRCTSDTGESEVDATC